jgi:tRNA 2-thiouridine synthesizing protein B
MQKILFTLLRSPFEKSELELMESIAGDCEKGVMLFEDAVYYATTEQFLDELLVKKYSIYAIEEELEARGLKVPQTEGIHLIDYNTAVEMIMEKYDKVVSL